MQTQIKKSNLLVIGLCVLMLMVPLQRALAQEPMANDDLESLPIESAESVVMEENVSGEAVAEPEDTAQVQSVDAPNRVFLPVVQGGDGNLEAAEVNFQHSWSADACAGVLPSERGLWDDMAGAGVNNESALFWFLENDSTYERCSYFTRFPVSGAGVVDTNNNNTLQVRVAVNDSARFYVSVYTWEGEFCTYLTGIATTETQDNSAFLTYTRTLPTGHRLCLIRISLNDAPVSTTAERNSALIDYIQLRSSTGVIGWQEQFTRLELPPLQPVANQ